MDFINNFKLDLKNIQPTEGKAQDFADQLASLHSLIESKLSEVGVKYNLDISLGDYGYGRDLVVEENHWSGYEVGSWFPSSESC